MRRSALPLVFGQQGRQVADGALDAAHLDERTAIAEAPVRQQALDDHSTVIEKRSLRERKPAAASPVSSGTTST